MTKSSDVARCPFRFYWECREHHGTKRGGHGEREMGIVLFKPLSYNLLT